MLGVRMVARSCMATQQHAASSLVSSRAASLWQRVFGSKEDKAAIQKEDKAYRNKLMEEAGRGPLTEMAEFKRNQGKRSVAPQTLVPAEKAPLFPQLAAKSLKDEDVVLPDALRGKVSLVVVTQRQISEPMASAYRNAFEYITANHRKAQGLQVHLIDQAVMRMLPSLVAKALRQAHVTDEAQRSTLLYLGKKAADVQQELKMFTRLSAFAFLTDSEGRIRWEAHGMPTSEEKNALLRLVAELLGDIRRGNAGPSEVGKPPVNARPRG